VGFNIAPETTDDEETEDSEEKKPKTKTIKETTSEWELLNDVKAVWLRSPREVTEEEYTKFYHSLAKVKTLVMNLILTRKPFQSNTVCIFLKKYCVTLHFLVGLW